VIGLVPAAGKGQRLNLPYPKELYPIIREGRFKPVSQYIIENMVAAGVDHTVIVINESKHQLIGYFGDGSRFDCAISYVVQDPDSAVGGPSGGLAQALDSGYHLVHGKTVLFGMADTIIEPTEGLQAMFRPEHESAEIVLGLFATDFPQKFGMVDMGANGIVRRIVDKPSETDLTHMWGCILWKPRFTEYLRERLLADDITDFAGIVNAAIDSGFVAHGAVIADGTYVDVGTYEEISELREQARKHMR